jgi:AhpD family alkylhydroperoxidase
MVIRRDTARTGVGFGSQYLGRPRTRPRGEWRGVVDGALDGKSNELIALTIAVTKQCDACHVSHLRGAAPRGAIVEEVADARDVAIVMSDGHGSVHAHRAFEAFQDVARR